MRQPFPPKGMAVPIVAPIPPDPQAVGTASIPPLSIATINWLRGLFAKKFRRRR